MLPSDKFQKDETCPYERGYWARYDGKPRPANLDEAIGWDACNEELIEEAQGAWVSVMGEAADGDAARG